jgi:hypothetical protein
MPTLMRVMEWAPPAKVKVGHRGSRPLVWLKRTVICGEIPNRMRTYSPPLTPAAPQHRVCPACSGCK